MDVTWFPRAPSPEKKLPAAGDEAAASRPGSRRDSRVVFNDGEGDTPDSGFSPSSAVSGKPSDEPQEDSSPGTAGSRPGTAGSGERRLSTKGLRCRAERRGSVRQSIVESRESMLMVKSLAEQEDIEEGQEQEALDRIGWSGSREEAHGGWISDIVEREQFKVERLNAMEGQRQPDEISMDLIRCMKGDAAALERLPEMRKHRTIIMRERLNFGIMEYVMKELKSKGTDENGWGRGVTETILRRSNQLAADKKEGFQLIAKVNNKVFAYKLFHSAQGRVVEMAGERRNRMEEFFTEVRDRAREPAPLEPRRVQEAREKAKEISPTAAYETWRLARTGPATCLEPGDRETRVMTKKSKCEKRLHYGMCFDGAAGSSTHWGVVSPAIGTRKALQLGEIPQTKTIGASIRGNGFGIRKQSSLPTLQRRPSIAASPPMPTRRRFLDADPSEGVARKFAFLPPLGNGARMLYLRECEDKGVIPTPLPFVTGPSQMLDARKRDLQDRDLDAITCMLSEVEGVERVDLSSNSFLTDKALAPFLRKLKNEPSVSTLGELQLAECQRASMRTVDEVTQLLQVAQNLRVINLCRIPIGTKFQLPLCVAIGKHPSLVDVNLCETGIGNNPSVTLECITAITKSRNVEKLDLGWNSFDSEEFGHLGKCLEFNPTVKTLHVSNCSAMGAYGSDAPVAFFFEYMARNTALTRLDISVNHIDYKSALVIEDSLQEHKSVRHIDFSWNPLGVPGTRSALRLLATETSGLTKVEMEGCFQGGDGSGHNEPKFNFTHPGNRYKLHLHKPYHRSILRMLYKITVQYGLKMEQTFVYTNPSTFVLGEKDVHGKFVVPEEGTVTFIFSIEAALEKKFKDNERANFVNVLGVYTDLVKVTPGKSKMVPLLFAFHVLEGKTMEQRCFVKALSRDFNLRVPHLTCITNSSTSFACEAIFHLMKAVPHEASARYLSLLLFPRLSEFLFVYPRMEKFLKFNVENPTGHYKLDLSNACDFATAETLVMLDLWEIMVDKKLERFDTSQRHNRSHFRNETYQGMAFPAMKVPVVSEWTMPEHGPFEFDYVSGRRPRAGTNKKPAELLLETQTFQDILLTLYDSDMHPEDQIACLNNISHHFYITAMQMRTLLGNFPTEEQRADVFINFFLRIVDIWNAKLFGVRFEKQTEIENLQHRLGYATFFPFIQPENYQFRLNFAVWDQRICLSILIKLALTEKQGNVRQPVYVRGDGTVDPMPTGIPRTWEFIDKLPPDGTFTCKYVCSPDDRKFQVRRKVCEDLSFFPCNVEEEEVEWWTGLLEPPPDVLDYLEFLICSGVDTADKAFEVIDGVGGNGEITLSEFRDSFGEMGCKKFEGPDEQKRIEGVFRYLDPGGEGTVSISEWGVMGQLWQEFELSVREFVEFVCRVFGRDLHVAWEFLDSDESGELDEDEWIEAVTKIGYFGPSRVVFALLDNSDDGNISEEEFMVLTKYVPQAPADGRMRVASRASLARLSVAAEGSVGRAGSKEDPS
eukprot:TRINITY_DN28799_c0_g1_i1.p1 TRINITY_DN28799_c0_g1~~TRINITY_DN28799_c0_g1_i1.p1  ORF type:complete len:1500 (+),score=349.89 TRINITY_DN28799_c0_g1_i1:97-4596(+)